jgi:hypothetical protein
MDIIEVKLSKETLEKTIHKLVETFELETKTTIDYINLIRVGTIGQENEELYKVSIKLGL